MYLGKLSTNLIKKIQRQCDGKVRSDKFKLCKIDEIVNFVFYNAE